MTRVAVLVILTLAAATDIAAAQLRGHGGPVRALAISPDGSEAVSGSFDTSVIRWSLRGNAAEQVLRFHDGAVDALLWLSDGRIVSSGEDARIALWRPREQKPSAVLAGHQAPVVALAVAPDGEWIASGSRDRTGRLWPLGATLAGVGYLVALRKDLAHRSQNHMPAELRRAWLRRNSQR